MSQVSSGRYLLIDAARLFAAVAIVWIHAAESELGKNLAPFCRFAVPFFVIAIVFFTLDSLSKPDRPSGWPGFMLKRFQRLYVPFIIWSVGYLILRLVKHKFSAGGSPINLGLACLLNGTAHHLWFLPFALLLSWLIFGLGTVLSSATVGWRHGIAVAGLIGGLVIGLAPSPVRIDVINHPVTYFLGLGWNALPAAMLTVPTVLWLPNSRSTVASILMAFGFGIACLAMLKWGEHPLMAAIAGLLLFLAARLYPASAFAQVFASAGSLAFGVYLAHVAFVEVFQVVWKRAGLGISIWSDLAISVLAILGAVALSWGCARNVRLKILCPS